MATKLTQILAHTLLEVEARRRAADYERLEELAAEHVPRGFAAGLRRVAETGPAVIAELKKASPSKGLIRSDFRPVELAKSLQAAGAAALSVLTDEEFFQGSLEYLAAASAVVSIPCLRKDFIIDPFQILEARAAGADAILLIVAAHTDEGLRRLFEAAKSFELDVLCEAHNAEEIRRAADLGFELIGVNSRDLTSLRCGRSRWRSWRSFADECGAGGGERDSDGRGYCDAADGGVSRVSGGGDDHAAAGCGGGAGAAAGSGIFAGDLADVDQDTVGIPIWKMPGWRWSWVRMRWGLCLGRVSGR